MASPQREVCYAWSGNSLLAGWPERNCDDQTAFLQCFEPHRCFALAARRSVLNQHSAMVVPRGCRWQISNWSEASRIWGTVATSVQACENTDNATFSMLSTEISAFLLPSCGNDPPLHEILFAPLLARGVCLTVQDPGQRIAGCARPSMTKNTAAAGLEGFLVERCKVPVYSLSVRCVGDSTDSASIPPLIAILSGSAGQISLSTSSPAPASSPDPSSLSVVFLRYWSP